MRPTVKKDALSICSMKQPTLSEATNTKLGSLIHGWSIPAEETCPGASHACRLRCYAKRGFFRMPNVERSHQGNYVFSQTPEFADWMISTCRAKFVRIMRVHVSGDFYDLDYIYKWHLIAQRSPHTRFYAYTRSWREEELLPALIKLSRYRNFVLWWSIDRETGPAPLVEGVRQAYMATDDVDANLCPDDSDLMFRDGHPTVMKRGNGVLVCPPENGVTEGVTCSKCGICWDKLRRPVWERLVLPTIRGEQEILAPELVCAPLP